MRGLSRQGIALILAVAIRSGARRVLSEVSTPARDCRSHNPQPVRRLNATPEPRAVVAIDALDERLGM